MSTTPHWTTADFVETRVLPVLLGMTLGIVAAQWSDETRYADRLTVAQEQAQQARKEARQAQALQAMYAEACGPLLSLPIEATPQLIHTAPARPEVLR